MSKTEEKILSTPVYNSRVGERPSGEVVVAIPFKLFRELGWEIEDELELVPIDLGSQLVIRKRNALKD